MKENDHDHSLILVSVSWEFFAIPALEPPPPSNVRRHHLGTAQTDPGTVSGYLRRFRNVQTVQPGTQEAAVETQRIDSSVVSQINVL